MANQEHSTPGTPETPGNPGGTPSQANGVPTSPDSESTDAMADEALRRVEAAADQLRQDTDLTSGAADLPELGPPSVRNAGGAPDLTMLHDVDLNVTIELGRTRMFVEDVVQLGADSVIELDKAAGDPVDVFVNGRKVARGEVLVLNDNFCIRVSEIISAEQAAVPSGHGGAVLQAGNVDATREQASAG